MSRVHLLFSLFLVLCTLGLASCGSYSPPESCGEGVGGSANEALFNLYFTNMILVDSTTEQPGEPNEDGEIRYSPSDLLELQMEGTEAITIRACVQERTAGGEIAFNESKTIPRGKSTMELGAFAEGNYVIRVILGDTLIKNFPFLVEE
jgi:hypothetical protein